MHLVRLYLSDGSNAELSRRAAIAAGPGVVAPGSPGSRLDPGLVPPDGVLPDAEVLLEGGLQQIGPNEWLMFKPRWGAFFGTPLTEHLRGLDVDTTVVVGANFPHCPRTTLYGASERDFHAVLVTDAVSGIYERGIAECEGIGVAATTAEDVIAGLDTIDA